MYHILITPKMTQKGKYFLNALHVAAEQMKLPVTSGPEYRTCKMLVTYGLGGDDRMPVAMSHMKSGGQLVAFDLGYWDRGLSVDARKFRVAINGFHPREVMNGAAPSRQRWESAGLRIEADRNKAGPIMLVGNAPKAVAIGAAGWTANRSREIRAVFPGAKILYRPKPKRPHEGGVVYDQLSAGPIERELSRVSLVVCRHSNVAVDACRMGVPVVCDDGAGACIYPQHLREYQSQPDIAKRTEFLHRLAYWQWSANEAGAFWNWLFTSFPEYRY